jgi:hypothetical protein
VTVGVPFELRHRIDPNNASQDLIEFLIGGAIVWSYTDTTPLTATFLAAISALSSLTGVGIASVRWIDYT